MRKALLILISLALFACNEKVKTKSENGTKTDSSGQIQLSVEQEKNGNIVLGTLSHKSISSELKVTGKIDVPPQNMVSVSFPLGGYLRSTKLLPGMHIKKAEIIAVLEDQQYIQMQQDYLTAKARQSFLENEYNRQKELNTSKASSDKSFQQSEADYKTNRILVRSLYEKLRLIGLNPDTLNEANISRSVNVISPIDGFVSKVNVNIGKYINPSEVLFELVNPTDIHLNLTVFEKDIAQLSIGQKVLAYTNANPKNKYPCEVILIGQDITQDRSIEVHCHFEKYDKNLVPGMFMNGLLEIKNLDMPALPEDAVVQFEGKSYVFVSLGNHLYELIEIESGVHDEGMIAVISSKKPLESLPIVEKGAYVLLMAMKNSGEE